MPEEIWEDVPTDQDTSVAPGFAAWLAGYDLGYVRGASDTMEALRLALLSVGVPEGEARRILQHVLREVPLVGR